VKGLDSTISLVLVLVVSIAAVLVISVMLDGNLGGLENFYESLDWRPERP